MLEKENNINSKKELINEMIQENFPQTKRKYFLY